MGRHVEDRLYLPADPPEIPRHSIGRLVIPLDTWERIGGVGRYAEHGRATVFRAVHRPDMSSSMIELLSHRPGAVVPATEAINSVICKRVELWRDGRYTFTWRAVVESADDQELVRRLGGPWVAAT